jgi:dUTP pyrophosphatase
VLQNNIGILDFDNARRKLPEGTSLQWSAEDWVDLIAAGPYGATASYLVTYNETITVPPDCAGIVLPRSTLLRCGAVLHSALWDPGYSGKGQGLLVVYHPLKLYRNARIGQFVLWRMEQAAQSLYQGRYQGENLANSNQDGIQPL